MEYYNHAKQSETKNDEQGRININGLYVIFYCGLNVNEKQGGTRIDTDREIGPESDFK